MPHAYGVYLDLSFQIMCYFLQKDLSLVFNIFAENTGYPEAVFYKNAQSPLGTQVQEYQGQQETGLHN